MYIGSGVMSQNPDQTMKQAAKTPLSWFVELIHLFEEASKNSIMGEITMQQNFTGTTGL